MRYVVHVFPVNCPPLAGSILGVLQSVLWTAYSGYPSNMLDFLTKRGICIKLMHLTRYEI